MDFYEMLDQVVDLLRNRRRVTYRALRRLFDLDDTTLEDLKEEILFAHPQVADEQGRGLVWAREQQEPPLAYTPQHLTEKILTSRSALEGERKLVTVCFADIKDSTELIKDLDPEAAQQLLDPAIHIMMHAVHRFEGTVNQVLGDGIMALFGAPIAHEDHALRACYAALAMQAAMRGYTEDVRRTHGIPLQIRVGLNAGEVVVRTIGNDLHMDYSAVGSTTHLAARMEQLATPGSIMLTAATLRLVEGFVLVNALGPIPIKGMTEPVEAYELTGASAIKRRLQAAAARGLTRFVGRDAEIEVLRQTLEQAEAGHGQVVASVGEAGVGKSRLVYEFVQSYRTQGWLVLESASVSYGKATPYFPVVDLLKHYAHVEEGDEPRTIRAKVTGQILTLDASLQETIPAFLSLVDALPEDSTFLQLDPLQRRRRTLDALKRILLRESQVQPLLLVFEDLQWIDSETQTLLDSLVESIPTAQILLLVNYRPEYQHDWGSKTYYTQLRLDPLPPESADAFLQALLGDHPSLEPLKQLLIERTEGNPFFLEESVRTLVETQGLIGEPGAYRLVQNLPSIQVPPTVQAVLAARIDRLPPEEKRLLQTAAVIGTEVPLPLLQAIAELSNEALHRGLTHLQVAEFLYETRLFPEREYTFKHALTQNVAYQSLLTATRQQVHQQIAQALETCFPETAATQSALLAHHYTEAGCGMQAIGYWQQAGQRARERAAYVEAQRYFTRGLESIATLPETPERLQRELDVHIALGAVLAATKGQGSAEVEQTYLHAQALCQQVNDPSGLFRVLQGLYAVYFLHGDMRTSLDLAQQLLTLAEHAQDADRLVEVHRQLGHTLYMMGAFPTARTHQEHAAALYDPRRHRFHAFRFIMDTGVANRAWLAQVLWMLGYPDQSYQHNEATLDMVSDTLDPFTHMTALTRSLFLLQLLRQARLGQQRAEEVILRCTELGAQVFLGMATASRGWALTVQGRIDEGMAQIRQGMSTLQHTGTGLLRPYHLALLAEACGAAGQPQEGLRVLDEAHTVMEHTGIRFWEAEQYRLRGELLQHAACGMRSAEWTPEACFHKAIEVARHQQARSWELRAATSLSRLWRRQGKCHEAQALLTPIYGWFTEGFDTADLKQARALLEELAG